MPEAEARRNGAVGPFVVARILQKRHPARQRRACCFDVRQSGLSTCRNCRSRKLHAGDAGNFEQPLLFGLQPRELLRDHLNDVARHDSIGPLDQVL